MKHEDRTEKFCVGCDRTLPLGAFQKCARRGVQARCRECRAAAAVEYRQRTKERRAAYDREYLKRNPDRLKKYHEENRERRLEAMRQWNAANRAKVAETSRAWYEANRERHREAGRGWAAANAEKVAEYHREYYLAHRGPVKRKPGRTPEEARAARRAQWPRHREAKRRNQNARRARKLDQFVEHVDPLMVLERDDGLCGICGGDVDPRNYHVDHIIPLSRGGEHSYANVQVAHPLCNIRKGGRLP